MWVLLALSFGALKANAQTQAEVDSVKKFSTEFLRDKLATDPELLIDTVWVKYENEVEDWGSFGEYRYGNCSDGSCEIPQVIIKYLASKIQDQKLQNKIALANGVVSGIYSHEGGDYGHRGRKYEMYSGVYPGWSVSDFVQKCIVSELAARLAEEFDMREKILTGQLSRNLVKNIANNMPKSKEYNKEYFLWLVENKITERISKTEADLMLKSIIKWMKTSKGRYTYFENAAFWAGFRTSNNIDELAKENFPEKDMADMDAFMNRSFTVGKNSVLKMANQDVVDEFMHALALAIQSQEKVIEKQNNMVDNGWGKASKKVADKYKKFIARDSKSKLRATRYTDLKKHVKEK
jgi:hypothetical protein